MGTAQRLAELIDPQAWCDRHVGAAWDFRERRRHSLAQAERLLAVATTEYAVEYSDGDMRIYLDDPEVNSLAPLAGRIAHDLRVGCRVHRRQALILGDWERIRYTGQQCATPTCRMCSTAG